MSAIQGMLKRGTTVMIFGSVVICSRYPLLKGFHCMLHTKLAIQYV